LEQQDSQFFSQSRRILQEKGDVIFRLGQLFHVGDKAAGFDRKGEVIWGGIMPLLEDALFGQSVEGMVDFHRPEMTAVVTEPIRTLQARRVEYSPGPVFVIPATGSHKAAGFHRAISLRVLPPVVDFDHIISKTSAGILNKIKVFCKLTEERILRLGRMETDFRYGELPMIKESSGKIADRFYALGNPGLPAFLVLGKEPALFESGMTFMGPTYLRELKTHLGDAGRLHCLLLTHSHYDHCGAAPFLKRKIPGLQIGASRLAADIFNRPNAVRLIQSLSRDPEEKSKHLTGDEDISFHSLEVDRLLADGEELRVGDGDRVRVIATPGHTRDALSFYFPEWKALIAGEAVGSFDRKFHIQPNFLSSYEDYLASQRRLEALDVQILLMGHFHALTGEEARKHISESIKATAALKEKIEILLDELGGEQEAVVKRIFREDYEEGGAILQDEEPYRINLRAKVKVVAEKK